MDKKHKIIFQHRKTKKNPSQREVDGYIRKSREQRKGTNSKKHIKMEPNLKKGECGSKGNQGRSIDEKRQITRQAEQLRLSMSNTRSIPPVLIALH